MEPLVDYMTTDSKPHRCAAFLRTYAERVRNGTAASWEIPNTVAATLEDIANELVRLQREQEAFAVLAASALRAASQSAQRAANRSPQRSKARAVQNARADAFADAEQIVSDQLIPTDRAAGEG